MTMSFVSGFILGGIVGGSLGLIIATLLIASGRASRDGRVHEPYRVGLGQGSPPRVGQVLHPSYEDCFPNEAEMIQAWLIDWNVNLSLRQKEKLDEIAEQIDEQDSLQQN